MYRPDEMALILEQARQEVKKNQLASTGKEVKTITWDGAVDNKLMINFNDHVDLVKISVAPIDFEKSAPIKVTAQQDTVSKTFESFQVMNEEMDTGSASLVLSNELGKTALLAMSVFGTLPTESEIMYEEGLYLAKFVGGSSSAGYVSSLEYMAEVIHPIPQEYIPPLDRLILNGADGNQYALTITDGAISVAPVTT